MVARSRFVLFAALVAFPCGCAPGGSSAPAPLDTGMAPSPVSSGAPAPAPSPSSWPAGQCGFSPSDWCPSPPGDPCGAHHDKASCQADARCQGMRYRGESLVACQYDDRGFAGNCPTVGCMSR